LVTLVKTMLSSFARTPGAGEVASAVCRPVCVVMGRRWMTSCSKSSGRAGVFSSTAIEVKSKEFRAFCTVP